MKKKTYKETKAEIKKLVIEYGVHFPGIFVAQLLDQGHNGTNIQNAISYFQFSPVAAKYR